MRIYEGMRHLLHIPIMFFVMYLVMYSFSDDPVFLEMAYWTWAGSLVSLLASAYLIWENTSDWFWEMAVSWYEGTFRRTPTGYWFRGSLTHIVITSSQGPMYSGIVMIDGKTVSSQLNSLDVTLFMKLIGDS